MRRLVVMLLALCAACSDGTKDPERQPIGGPCSSEASCVSGAECVDGTCVGACAHVRCGDACCATNEMCSDGVCTRQASACEAGGGTICGQDCCGGGEECYLDQCRPTCETARCGVEAACCAADEMCHLGLACCREDRICGEACCGEGQACSDGVCRNACEDGRLGCGAADTCCGDGELCVQGSCLVPGASCTPGAVCATRPEASDCPEGEVCDAEIQRCVPRVVDETCTFTPPPGVFEPRPQFSWGRRRARTCVESVDCQTGETCQAGECAVGWPHVTPTTLPDHYQACSIPMVADLDGDCVPDIVFNTYERSAYTTGGVLRAIRGDDGSELWTVTDAAYRTDGTGNPAIGDVDGDGSPEVFTVGPGRNLLRVAADGTPVWVSEPFAGADGSGSVTIAQLDEEGDAELVFGAAVFDSSGRLLAEGGEGRGHSGIGPISCVADLDGDGRPELIAGRSVYETEGRVAEGTFSMRPRVSASTPDGYCGLADFDGDGAPEIVLVASGAIYLLQGQTMAVMSQLNIPGGGHGGAPNIADFDGDGRPDIGTAGASFYVVVVYDPVEGELSELWRAPTEDDSSSRTGSSVFDFDGDGRSEVVYNDEEYVRIYPGVEPDCRLTPVGPGCDGLMTDDEVLFRDLNSSRTRSEYPVIADVDGDFKAEIVFSTSNEASFLEPSLVGDAGIEVWGDVLNNWVPTRPVWNQHAYAVTSAGPRAQIPDRPEPSWTPSYNAWRRNAQGGRNPLCAPDLVLTDVRQDDSACPDLKIVANVVNRGCLAAIEGVDVRVEEADATELVRLQDALPIGAGEYRRVELVGSRGPDYEGTVQLTVDPDDLTRECREENNVASLELRCRNEF